MLENKYEKVLSFWQKKEIQNSGDLDAVVNGQAVSLAYHTTKLELSDVTFHDTREVFERGRVTGYTGDVVTLFALQNARRAWELFLDAFDARRPFDETLVKDFHLAISAGTYDERRYKRGERPGQYKIGDYVTGFYEVGAPPEDVSEEMRELLSDLQDVSDDNALIAAAFFHAKFENIHPFADGNGRAGRLLMNYFLVAHNHPVIVIHEEDRKPYMEALEQWDSGQALDPLADFLKEQTVKTWENK